jgi:hypothetical protein
MPASSRIHFCVAHGSRTTVPNYVMLRQSNRILPHHIRPLENGITLASWERLAFDLATDLRRFDLSSVVEQMVQWTVTDMERLGAVAREMCGPGRAGSRSFAGVLLDRHPGAAAESHPELRVLVGLRARGVPVVPQVSPLVLNDGTRIRIDMAVPDLKWAVEVDVHPDHLDLVGTTRDKRRDRQLHLIGWQVERVTRLDLLDLRGTLTELAQLYARRAAQLVA